MMTTTNSNPTLILTARVLLALMFVLAGISKLTGLEGTAGYIASKGLPMPSVLALATGLLEVIAGLMLAVGFQTRIAAAALAAFTVVASLLFHNFWAMEGAAAMTNQLMFMKNLAIVGGLLMVFTHGAGPASVDMRRLAVAR